MNDKKIIALLTTALMLVSCEKKQPLETKNETEAEVKPAEISTQKTFSKPDDWYPEFDGFDSLKCGFEGWNNNYEAGEKAFDEKKYEDAIESYTKVYSRILSKADEVKEYYEAYGKSDGYKKAYEKYFNVSCDENGEIKLLYYSLYNIACCYSCMENYEKAKEFLFNAIYAGYPYLKHIFKDEDLKAVFQSDPNLKSEVKELFERGNRTDLVNGKEFEVWVVNDCTLYGFDGDTVIMTFATSDWKEDKCRGKYSVKNYHVFMHFDEKTYQKPDEWASPLPGAGMITTYTSYNYPEHEKISRDQTFNWFIDKISASKERELDFDKLYEREKPFKAEWDETDYTSLIEQRKKEFYSRNCKIERTESEIRASALKRRQKVLDYIEKVGKDDRTVYIVPEGTKKMLWNDTKIEEGIVAVLLPEGLEELNCDFPLSVTYINLPSTLKKLNCSGFYGRSNIKSLEIPENIEEITGCLFFPPSEDKPHYVYVPGFSDKPAEWDQVWDYFCEQAYGSYERDESE